MNLRTVVCSVVAMCVGIAVLAPPQGSNAEPILKPRKYYGPIPKRYFTLSIGLVGGAANEEMWDLLDRMVIEPLRKETDTNDFGASLALDGAYTVKVHPQFAVRARTGLVLLRSGSTGKWKVEDEPTTYGFEREFNVWLLSLDGTALYYFQDASVKSFQTYFGAGLGAYFPYSIYREKMTDLISQDVLPEVETTEWDFQAGVHAILGFLYHTNPTTAFGMEGRVQMAMSKFALDYTNTVGEALTGNFDVDYTGFVLSLTASKFF